MEPDRRRRRAIILILASPVAAAAGFAIGVPALLPVLCAAPAYAAMVLLLTAGRRGAAIRAMLVWALLLGATMTAMTVLWPERAARVVIHGSAYWREMSAWLATGVGRESAPSEFLPQHLLHAGAFVALSLATASLLSILLGAVLMNYMAYYVGQVVLVSRAHPFAAALLGWHPWSVVRIASFVTLGVLLAEPLLSPLQGRPRPLGRHARWIALAAAGLVIDAALKALLAPRWAALLRSLQ